MTATPFKQCIFWEHIYTTLRNPLSKARKNKRGILRTKDRKCFNWPTERIIQFALDIFFSQQVSANDFCISSHWIKRMRCDVTHTQYTRLEECQKQVDLDIAKGSLTPSERPRAKRVPEWQSISFLFIWMTVTGKGIVLGTDSRCAYSFYLRRSGLRWGGLSCWIRCSVPRFSVILLLDAGKPASRQRIYDHCCVLLSGKARFS